jgi:DNA polymerase-1
MSCSEPNLQNVQPVIRAHFNAAPGHAYVYADYSQAQLRVLTDLSQDPVLLEAYQNDADVHAITARAILNGSGEDITPEQRRLAKDINFGLSFGLGARGLQRYVKERSNQDITEQQAEEFKDKFLDQYAGLYAWQQKQARAVVIRSYWGRKWADLPKPGDQYRTAGPTGDTG